MDRWAVEHGSIFLSYFSVPVTRLYVRHITRIKQSNEQKELNRRANMPAQTGSVGSSSSTTGADSQRKLHTESKCCTEIGKCVVILGRLCTPSQTEGLFQGV